MQINKKMYNLIKYFFLIIIYVSILLKGHGYMIFLFPLLSLCLLNDEYRKRIIKNMKSEVLEKRLFTLSVMVSILAGGIIKYYIGSDIYLYICLIDFMFHDKERLPTLLLGFHCFCFLVPNAVAFMNVKGVPFDFAGFGYDVLYYLAGLFIVILILEQVKQKEKFELLSRELGIKNELLKQQQGLKEELALSKEREIVAQELHDSIGHTLVAVKMHVKVLERYVGCDTEKEKLILSTLNEVIQESIFQLRNTVYRLKNNSKNGKLKDALAQLINNIKQMESGQIHFCFDDEAEALEASIKEVVYKSIREGITNTMKYAKAKNIWISVKVIGNEVEFYVKDDGIGAAEIQKSFGIQGIEERIQALKGSCTFKSGIGQGFLLEAQINFEKQKVE